MEEEFEGMDHDEELNKLMITDQKLYLRRL